MEEPTQPVSPVQVQVVSPPDPQRAAEERFAEKLDRMGTAPSTPGLPQRQAPAPQAAEPQPAETADPAAPEEDDAYEFEFSGGRYQVPKELKELHDGYLRQQDYTQKQQEIAEIRRSAEALKQQSMQQQELHQALAPHVAKLNEINTQLNQYSSLDWNKLWSQDATLAQQHSVNFSVLNNQKQVLERELNQSAQQHVKKITDAQNSALEAADKAMSLKVKGWTRETGKALGEFARKSYGFTENEVSTTLDPRALELMHDAKQWRDLQASKSSKVVVPEKTLKPAAAQPANTAQQKVAELRKGFRSAKSDGQRDRIAEQIFATKLR